MSEPTWEELWSQMADLYHSESERNARLREALAYVSLQIRRHDEGDPQDLHRLAKYAAAQAMEN